MARGELPQRRAAWCPAARRTQLDFTPGTLQVILTPCYGRFTTRITKTMLKSKKGKHLMNTEGRQQAGVGEEACCWSAGSRVKLDLILARRAALPRYPAARQRTAVFCPLWAKPLLPRLLPACGRRTGRCLPRRVPPCIAPSVTSSAGRFG